MSPLRIALYHNLPSGGAKRAVVELTRQLVQAGHQVDEYTFSMATLSFLPLQGLVSKSVVKPFAPFTWTKLPLPGISPQWNVLRRLRYLQQFADANRALAAEIEREPYDLVWLNDCIVNRKPYLTQYLTLPNVFYMHHGPYETDALYLQAQQPKTGRLQQLWYGSWQRWLHQSASQAEFVNACSPQHILANSDFTAESYLQFYGVPARVCYLGVDAVHFAPVAEARQAYILSVGALIYRKGHRWVIRAVAGLPAASRPPVRIVADSGEPAERQYLTELAQRLGVTLQIEQFIDHERLRQTYAQAKMMVCAAYLEPFGLAPLEALACGTPVVAVREGGLRESILHEQTGLLVPRDVPALTNAIARLLSQPAQAEQFGQNGRAQVLQFWNWAQAGERLQAEFRRVLQPSTEAGA
jgi:glycosyltransferase involved in cell wall biosynthesis